MGAPSFKDCVAADIHGVFLNAQEFADTHTIDGREMDAVVDDDALLERDAARGGVHTDGTYRTRRLLYVSKSDYGGRPMSGKALNLDGREYRVVQADEAAGTVVYCGPSIKGVARQFTAYNNGIPEGLKAATEKNKVLAAMIVPLEDLPEAMRQLRQKSGRIYTLYKAVQGKT